MIIDVEVLNILKYEDKKNPGKYCCRLSYRLLDTKSIANTGKFKGYSECSLFIDGFELFDKFDHKYCGTHLKFELEEKAYTNNPFKKYCVLKAIKSEDGKDLYTL